MTGADVRFGSWLCQNASPQVPGLERKATQAAFSGFDYARIAAIRKQRRLAPINPLNEAPHPIPPPKNGGIIQRESNDQLRFHTARVIGSGEK
jgi:hypothetical protein